MNKNVSHGTNVIQANIYEFPFGINIGSATCEELEGEKGIKVLTLKIRLFFCVYQHL